jgi:hypothetical protein
VENPKGGGRMSLEKRKKAYLLKKGSISFERGEMWALGGVKNEPNEKVEKETTLQT